MRDISEYNGVEDEALNQYHDRIKTDLVEFMLIRMATDVRSVKEHAEFINACVSAAATLAASQAVVLSAAAKDVTRHQPIIDNGRQAAIENLTLAYQTQVDLAFD